MLTPMVSDWPGQVGPPRELLKGAVQSLAPSRDACPLTGPRPAPHRISRWSREDFCFFPTYRSYAAFDDR